MSTAAAAETGPTPDETIRRTVRALRSAYEVDARDLARHLGISRQSLYNRLNGVAPWLAAEIVGLAIFFNCEISDFYTGNVRIDPAAKASVHGDPSGAYAGHSGNVIRLVPHVPAVTHSAGPADPRPGGYTAMRATRSLVRTGEPNPLAS